jgi:hypothetical protein
MCDSLTRHQVNCLTGDHPHISQRFPESPHPDPELFLPNNSEPVEKARSAFSGAKSGYQTQGLELCGQLAADLKERNVHGDVCGACHASVNRCSGAWQYGRPVIAPCIRQSNRHVHPTHSLWSPGVVHPDLCLRRLFNGKASRKQE